MTRPTAPGAPAEGGVVPLFAAAISVALGQEALTTTLVVGALAVIGGVALAQRR